MTVRTRETMALRTRGVVALAGGVGAARFLRGLIRVVAPENLTVVANTGDDLELHGLHISPDLDTITYTLGGGVHPAQGWGRAEESFVVAEELARRYEEPSWFTLGDRDLATHMIRTGMLRAGSTLSDVTIRIARAWGLPFRLLPMSNDPVTTVIDTTDGRTLHFQEWWVGERTKPDPAAVRLVGSEHARPAPGVLEAVDAAEFVLLCPSNPVVSIGTILQVPGIRERLRSATVIGVSPIVGGRVIRGMADRLLPVVGAEVSAAGVATLYRDFLDGWVVDEADREQAVRVDALGVRTLVADTVMRSVDVTERLAHDAVEFARGLPEPRERT